MNFPLFESCDSIWVVVNCLTKMVHFIPYNKIIISKKTIKLFLDHVFRYHGLLEDIISNHETSLHPSFGRAFLNY
jgi:hypothetical protein